MSLLGVRSSPLSLLTGFLLILIDYVAKLSSQVHIVQSSMG